MDHTVILAKLVPILEDTFTDTDSEFTLTTTREEIEEWDSLAQVRLFLAVEMAFGFRFDLDDMQDIYGVEDLVNLIHKKVH